ncbi:type II restriction endonuclease [Spirochaetia bacterium]|nr:type II restriction endonuclease [Spirochaetia bacterium]
MPELSIKQSLNKAFIKVRLERAQIELFKRNFAHLLIEINNNSGESEEFLKNAVCDFFKNTWYAPTYHLNTSGKIDLVIREGNTTESPIGVIIETKAPKNQGEMITKDDLNKKALQEVLLYYLRERIGNNNLGIKYLIITNTIEWFIFNGAEFEEKFAVDKKLITFFNDYNNKRLLDDGTGFFYKEIAAGYIEPIKDRLNYTYFNVKDYESFFNSNDKTADNKLIDLYKLLSPQHLLKLPFENDSNTLNVNFYSELLYIMGLSEEKMSGKKLIVRPKEQMRIPSSLIEQTIFNLRNYNIEEEQVFDTALNLVITWINRILFLKLLESQQLTYQNGDTEYSFLNIDKITSFNELNTLFFQVLAVEPKNRAGSIKEKFKNVPYLNSSLFDMTDKEKDYFPIQALQSNEIPIFNLTVLKESLGKKRIGKINCLKYIFEFLDAYDFASEGKEEIAEDNKTLINASVLGLIFEKINGYKDGSFFTPGFITTYICRETLRPVVVNKFNEIKGWTVKDFEELKTNIFNSNDTNIIKEANTIINSITVCDPSVGSGHFLVSALNEIIAIKSDLGILVDEKGRRLRGYPAEVINDELIIFNEDHKLFVYNYKNEESRRIQKTIFEEKQKIIEGSLFGVDINPNSVKICRLRLWIELLKNAYYTAESNYTELETFPNIDINIKCGNSLISRFPLDIDIKNELQKIEYTVKDYQDAVHSYKNTTLRAEKQKLVKLITKIKNNFRVEIGNYDPIKLELKRLLLEIENLKQDELFEPTSSEKAAKEKKIKDIGDKILVTQNKLEEKENGVIYKDAFEWRFEFPEVLNEEGNFKGFDVVMGNPPYISAPAMVETNPKLRDEISNSARFTTLYQKWDLFIPFMELGIQLLPANGMFTMIVPYPFTNQNYGKKLREMIIDKYNLKEVVDLNGTKVFDSATVSNCITIIQKTKKGSSCFISNINEEKLISKVFEQPYSDLVQDKETTVWNLTTEERGADRHSNMKVLGDFCYISVGMVLNADEKTAKGEFSKDDLISEAKDEIHCRKYIEAKDIEKYRVKKFHYLEYNTERCPDKLRRPTFKELYEKPKLMFNRLGSLQVYLDKKTKFLHSDSMYSAILWKDLKKVNNKSITASITRYSNHSRKKMEEFSKNIDLRYLLGILNSKYAQVLLTNIRGGDYHIYPEHIRNLPIPNATKKQQKQIIELVDIIITAKKNDANAGTTEAENKIDKMVYKLYGLKKDEINAAVGKQSTP